MASKSYNIPAGTVFNLSSAHGMAKDKGYLIQNTSERPLSFSISATTPSKASDLKLAAGATYQYKKEDGSDLFIYSRDNAVTVGVAEFFFNSGGGGTVVLPKATGAQINQGFDNSAYVTPYAIKSSSLLKEGYIGNLDNLEEIPDGYYVPISNGQDNKRVSIHALAEKSSQPSSILSSLSPFNWFKGLKAEDGQKFTYAKGQIVPIYDDTDPMRLIHGQFIVFKYTKTPSWYKGDVPNFYYAVKDTDQKTLLINSMLTETTNLILSKAQAANIAHWLDNTGRMFFEPTDKKLYVYIDGDLKEIGLRSALKKDKQP